MARSRQVQFGCGLSCPDDWLNYDTSPRLRLERLPIVGRFVPAGPYGRFPRGVLYGDIVKGLPLPDESAELLYSSHVFEHLCVEHLRKALRNSHRLLVRNGVFRIVLPDLNRLIQDYTQSAAPDRAFTFIRNSLMGQEASDRGFLQWLTNSVGNHRHLWLWDYDSLALELRNVGFSDVRPAVYGDSGIDGFASVEASDRWHNGLGIQCRR